MRKILISGMLSNGLEWYDFALYAYTATTISKLFFPAGDETAHWLLTLGIFAVGFVARPFGAVLFGYIGDKFGRRVALVTSIFMMAIPTACIGLLPTYAQIGIAAPIILTVIRVLQGLSLGGAFSGCITFLVEHAPQRNRGLIGSASIASLVIGFLLGSVIAGIVKAPLTEAQYEDWGWRVPFLIGLIIGFIGFYIRKHCDESPAYAHAKKTGALSATPVRDTFTHEFKHMMQAIGIYITVTMPFYLLSAYFIAFTELSLHRSKEEALLLNSMNMLVLFAVCPISGWLSDRIGRKKIITGGALLFALATYPIFTLLQQPDLMSIAEAQAMFAVMVGIYTGPVPTLLVEIFPTRLRYTGMSLSYNISAALFGGTTPMVCAWLLAQTHDAYSIAYYVIGSAVISLFTIYFFRDRHDQPLQ